jgi:hypothetical protein
MEKNAKVCWVQHRQPWLVEADVIKSLRLPFNLTHNPSNAFRSELRACRAALKQSMVKAAQQTAARDRVKNRGA